MANLSKKIKIFILALLFIGNLKASWFDYCKQGNPLCYLMTNNKAQICITTLSVIAVAIMGYITYKTHNELKRTQNRLEEVERLIEVVISEEEAKRATKQFFNQKIVYS